ncbi:MAG: DUF6483 family protein [Chloroflexales bacterium]|nr:DUF6483 family protein [Chloroflexales bacterium]
MIRDDYVMRMIKQFAQIVAYILGLRRSNQYPLALISIDNALRELLGLGSESVARLSDSELLALVKFSAQSELWRERGAILATLLQEEGNILVLQEQPEAGQQRHLRALQVLLEVVIDTDQAPLPNYTPSVEELLEILHDIQLPVKTSAALIHYYEQAQAYSKAEDLLFELRNAHPNDADISAFGLAFYERLRQQSDDDLIAGNLPRDEVEASLAEWVRIRGA